MAAVNYQSKFSLSIKKLGQSPPEDESQTMEQFQQLNIQPKEKNHHRRTKSATDSDAHEEKRNSRTDFRFKNSLSYLNIEDGTAQAESGEIREAAQHRHIPRTIQSQETGDLSQPETNHPFSEVMNDALDKKSRERFFHTQLHFFRNLTLISFHLRTLSKSSQNILLNVKRE